MKSKSVLLWLTLALFAVQHIAAETYSGTDGNIHWILDTESGELIISGTGAMNNYSSSASRTTAPWGTYYLNIKTATIQSGVTSIGSHAFCGYRLAAITLPEGVTTIGFRTFQGCSALNTVTVPNSVTKIDSEAFRYCANISTIHWDSNLSPLHATQYCREKLTEVTLGNTMNSVGENAFYGCTSLADITIPENVTDIGNNAFRGCTSLVTITISENVTTIGDGFLSGCSGLMEINTRMSDPPALKNTAFTDVDKDVCQLIVPAASVDIYKQTSGWRDFNNIVADPDTDHIDSMEEAESNDIRYNLSGQRINTTEKGIVIITGKKHFIK